jgi:ubiquinone/menaquinone biosynthesis C-methylase UbiE
MEGFIARWYSRIQSKSMGQYTEWAKKARDSIEASSDVLEIAPGPGYLSIELAKLGSYRIVGLDISKTFVDIAQEKARAAGVQVEFRQGDAAYMPFPTETFDFAICTSAFKNFPEPVKVLNEVFRVLKTGGKALIIDLKKDAPKSGIDEYIDGMGLNMIDSFITRRSFSSLLKNAYTKSAFLELVSKSDFGKCEIQESSIGLEVSLQKR